MNTSETQSSVPSSEATRAASVFGARGPLRPSAKVLPEHARGHNRSLVLQTLYASGPMSRADVSRETGLTRVTVSDLVADLISEELILDLGPREGSRPGKPATLLDVDRAAHQIIGMDLSEHDAFHAALMNLDGEILDRLSIPLAGAHGEDALNLVIELARAMAARATKPLQGIGVGTPGIVDFDGVILRAPNLGWKNVPLRALLSAATGEEVIVANDANAAALAEHGFGGADSNFILIRIGHGVGSGLLVDGSPLVGSRFAAGEIGHVSVGTDGGPRCACGKEACLETWLATPRLDAEIARITATEPTEGAREEAITGLLRQAGERLGIALAPVLATLDLTEVVLAGPPHLLDGELSTACLETLRGRTMSDVFGDVRLRTTDLGRDIVLRGSAVMVLLDRLGVS